jgi:hypothetical protein
MTNSSPTTKVFRFRWLKANPFKPQYRHNWCTRVTCYTLLGRASRSDLQHKCLGPLEIRPARDEYVWREVGSVGKGGAEAL